MSVRRDQQDTGEPGHGGFGSAATMRIPGGATVLADAAREVWASALCALVDPELLSGALSALGGAIKVVLLFGVPVGLVMWARTKPESWKAAMSQVAGLGVFFVTWLAGLL